MSKRRKEGVEIEGSASLNNLTPQLPYCEARQNESENRICGSQKINSQGIGWEFE